MGSIPTGGTGKGAGKLRFLRSGAAEWLRFIEEDRERKPSTLVDYRSALKAHLLPAFGDRPLESITAEEIERWRRSLTGLSNRSKNKLLIQLHGIFRRAQIVWNVPVNPLARFEKHPMRPSGDIQVFSPERSGRHPTVAPRATTPMPATVDEVRPAFVLRRCVQRVAPTT